MSSRCTSEDGQCPCLPNMVGRRCSEPANGYFLPQLDFYLYEAELATPLYDGGSPPAQPTASSSSSSLVSIRVFGKRWMSKCSGRHQLCSLLRVHSLTQVFHPSVSSTTGSRVTTSSSPTDGWSLCGGHSDKLARGDRDRWGSFMSSVLFFAFGNQTYYMSFYIASNFNWQKAKRVWIKSLD